MKKLKGVKKQFKGVEKQTGVKKKWKVDEKKKCKVWKAIKRCKK